MRKAARIVEMALAPMAGANGGELLLAPRAHAVTRLVTVASTTSAQKTSPGTVRRLRLRGSEDLAEGIEAFLPDREPEFEGK